MDHHGDGQCCFAGLSLASDHDHVPALHPHYSIERVNATLDIGLAPVA